MIRDENSRSDAPHGRGTAAATLIICIGGLIVAGVSDLMLPNGDPNAIFRTAAVLTGAVLTAALAVEARGGVRSLLRTNVLMLVALYGLTFLEFLFPQPDLSSVVSPASAVDGIEAVLLGFAGIAIGRHIVPHHSTTLGSGGSLSQKVLFRVFLACFVIGYLHMFLAVNFDVLEVLRQMTLPRFSQAWARGQLGDWASLLNELGLLIYLIPPIAGLVLARHKEYKMGIKFTVLTVLAFTFFYGFSSGTRNVFMVFLLTFTISFLIFKRELKSLHLGITLVAVAVAAMVATYFMLEFRDVGLRNYSINEGKSDTLFVDNNVVVISNLTEVFPETVDYLGVEVPYVAITKPIPRALWPGKPEGLSFSAEDALGAEGLTIACTFVGESYIAGGFFGVLLASVFLGAAAGRWNRMGMDLASDFNLLLYVSGFFAATLAMRSILQVMPAVLPTLALWLYAKLWLPKAAQPLLPSPDASKAEASSSGGLQGQVR